MHYLRRVTTTACYNSDIRPSTMLERTMPRLSMQPQLAQLKLFHPLVKSPNWYALPLEVRQQALRLLARLLREAVVGDRAASQAGGLGDE